MVLKYFRQKLLKLIYEKHKEYAKEYLVIYEDTKGKTHYKTLKYTTMKENTYNSMGYFIVLVQRFYKNGYYSENTIHKKCANYLRIERKFINIDDFIDKLIKLFN